MKKQKPNIISNTFPLVDNDLEKVDFDTLTSSEYRKQFKNSLAYKRYVHPVLEREKNQKLQQRKDWWKDNWIQFISLLFAFIAALPVIFGAVEYILSTLM